MLLYDPLLTESVPKEEHIVDLPSDLLTDSNA